MQPSVVRGLVAVDVTFEMWHVARARAIVVYYFPERNENFMEIKIKEG